MQTKDLRWWLKDNPSPHASAWAAFSSIRDADQSRRAFYRDFARMYSNSDLLGLGPTTATRTRSNESLTLNVVQQVTDSVVSRVARQRIRPQFLTSGGNWSLTRKARGLSRFVEAQFYLNKAHEVMPRVMLDAAVFGTGVARVWRDGKKIKLDRALPTEVFVDKMEGFYGKNETRTMYYRKFVNKEVLKAHFPKMAARIDGLATVSGTDGFRPTDYNHTNMLVEVIEAWHLPSRDKAGDGKRILFTEDFELELDDYNYDDFPFVFIRYRENLMGFYGRGIAENLLGVQKEINRILIAIQKNMKLLGAGTWVFLEQGSSVKAHQITNHPGTIIRYRGTPPIVKPNQSVHPEVFQQLDRLYQRAFEQEGVGQDLSQGIKPAGVTSGAGIRAAEDVQAGRFALTLRQYEQAHVDLSKWIVRMGKEIQQENPNWEVVAERDKHTIETIKFKDVSIEEDAFVLKVFPASNLPATPGGRLSMVGDMLNLGLVGPEEAKRLLDFPDIDAALALDRAAEDFIDRLIENMLDEGEYESPEPFMDQELALKKVQGAYQRAVSAGAPEDRLRLLRDFLVQTQSNVKAAQAEQAALIAPASVGAPPPVGFDGAAPTALQADDGSVPI